MKDQQDQQDQAKIPEPKPPTIDDYRKQLAEAVFELSQDRLKNACAESRTLCEKIATALARKSKKIMADIVSCLDKAAAMDIVHRDPYQMDCAHDVADLVEAQLLCIFRNIMDMCGARNPGGNPAPEFRQLLKIEVGLDTRKYTDKEADEWHFCVTGTFVLEATGTLSQFFAGEGIDQYLLGERVDTKYWTAKAGLCIDGLEALLNMAPALVGLSNRLRDEEAARVERENDEARELLGRLS